MPDNTERSLLPLHLTPLHNHLYRVAMPEYQALTWRLTRVQQDHEFIERRVASAQLENSRQRQQATWHLNVGQSELDLLRQNIEPEVAGDRLLSQITSQRQAEGPRRPPLELIPRAVASADYFETEVTDGGSARECASAAYRLLWEQLHPDKWPTRPRLWLPQALGAAQNLKDERTDELLSLSAWAETARDCHDACQAVALCLWAESVARSDEADYCVGQSLGLDLLQQYKCVRAAIRLLQGELAALDRSENGQAIQRAREAYGGRLDLVVDQELLPARLAEGEKELEELKRQQDEMEAELSAWGLPALAVYAALVREGMAILCAPK